MPQWAPVRNLSSPDSKGYTSRQLFARSSSGERPVDLPIRLPQIPTRPAKDTGRHLVAANFWRVANSQLLWHCGGAKPGRAQKSPRLPGNCPRQTRREAAVDVDRHLSV